MRDSLPLLGADRLVVPTMVSHSAMACSNTADWKVLPRGKNLLFPCAMPLAGLYPRGSKDVKYRQQGSQRHVCRPLCSPDSKSKASSFHDDFIPASEKGDFIPESEESRCHAVMHRESSYYCAMFLARTSNALTSIVLSISR